MKQAQTPKQGKAGKTPLAGALLTILNIAVLGIITISVACVEILFPSSLQADMLIYRLIFMLILDHKPVLSFFLSYLLIYMPLFFDDRRLIYMLILDHKPVQR